MGFSTRKSARSVLSSGCASTKLTRKDALCHLLCLICKVLARRVAKLGLQKEAIILRVNDWSARGASALDVIEHIQGSGRPLTIHFLPFGREIPLPEGSAQVSAPVKAAGGCCLFVHDRVGFHSLSCARRPNLPTTRRRRRLPIPNPKFPRCSAGLHCSPTSLRLLMFLKAQSRFVSSGKFRHQCDHFHEEKIGDPPRQGARGV